MANSRAIDMVANTDTEILAYAFDVEPESLPSYRSGADAEDALEMVEGWDGDPVDLDELAHIAEHGFPESNFDRPLQLAESERLEREIARRDEVIGIMQRQQGELEMRGNPLWQQQQAQQRADFEDAIVADPARAREYIENQRAEMAREFTARHVNACLADAHEEHGDEFVEAYQALTSKDPRDPNARAAVQKIWDSPNSGRALMSWWNKENGGRSADYSGGGGSEGFSDRGGGRGRMPPSLNSQDRGYRGRGASSSSRSQRRVGDSDGNWPVNENFESGGFTDEATERDVMNSVWR